MVEINITDNRTGYILLEPNRSANWKINLRFIGFLSVVCAVISAYMWSLGAWLVIPFFGLEIVLLFFAMHIFYHRNSYREVIKFSDDTVTIEKGRHYAEQDWELQRAWVRVKVINLNHKIYLPVVHLYSHGQSVQIGEFLNGEDKHILLGKLDELMSRPVLL